MLANDLYKEIEKTMNNTKWVDDSTEDYFLYSLKVNDLTYRFCCIEKTTEEGQYCVHAEEISLSHYTLGQVDDILHNLHYSLDAFMEEISSMWRIAEYVFDFRKKGNCIYTTRNYLVATCVAYDYMDKNQ